VICVYCYYFEPDTSLTILGGDLIDDTFADITVELGNGITDGEEVDKDILGCCDGDDIVEGKDILGGCDGEIVGNGIVDNVLGGEVAVNDMIAGWETLCGEETLGGEDTLGGDETLGGEETLDGDETLCGEELSKGTVGLSTIGV
jgi:hypothetical protein